MKIKGPIHHLALFILGLDILAIAWLLEASIRTIVFQDGTFFEQAFSPPPPAIWTRLSIAILLLSTLFLKLKRSELDMNKIDRLDIEQKIGGLSRTAADSEKLIENPSLTSIADAFQDTFDPAPCKRDHKVAHHLDSTIRDTITLLVVHDEPSMRKHIRKSLQPLGYRILESSCYEGALNLLKKLRQEIDLILTDTAITGMSGPEVAEALQGSSRPIRIFYLSGDPLYLPGYHDGYDMASTFFQKAAPPSSLADSLHQALRREGEKVKRA